MIGAQESAGEVGNVGASGLAGAAVVANAEWTEPEHELVVDGVADTVLVSAAAEVETDATAKRSNHINYR